VAVKTHLHAWLDTIQTATPTDWTALAHGQRLMAAHYVLGAMVGLGTLTPMPGAPRASGWRRVGVVSLRPRGLCGSCPWPSCAISACTATACGRLRRALLRRVAKHQRPQSLETKPGLLQGKPQPEIPPQHLLQHPPILRGQGFTVEALDQRLTVLTAQVKLVGSFHGRHS
jgi:hypothetical protein